MLASGDALTSRDCPAGATFPQRRLGKSVVPYGLTIDIFYANWRCGRNIFGHNGPAVIALTQWVLTLCTRVGGNIWADVNRRLIHNCPDSRGWLMFKRLTPFWFRRRRVSPTCAESRVWSRQ